ncbi:DUF1707 domain-containing protein [Streptosporangium lutulentum]
MAGTATPAASSWHEGVPTPGRRPEYAGLRVSNQDREQVVGHVKTAYAEGRLDKFEFDDRLERAMTARVHGDLMPIMHELYGSHPAPSYPPAMSRTVTGRHLDGRAGVGGSVWARRRRTSYR